MEKPPVRRPKRIGIVGPCGAGKSTLARSLQALGFQARAIAQEHSHVPDMWQRLTRPDLLVYLHASFETCTQRKGLHWTRADYEEELRRLAHARAHADIYIPTDDLSPEEVLQRVLEALTTAHSPLSTDH